MAVAATLTEATIARRRWCSLFLSIDYRNSIPARVLMDIELTPALLHRLDRVEAIVEWWCCAKMLGVRPVHVKTGVRLRSRSATTAASQSEWQARPAAHGFTDILCCAFHSRF